MSTFNRIPLGYYWDKQYGCWMYDPRLADPRLSQGIDQEPPYQATQQLSQRTEPPKPTQQIFAVDTEQQARLQPLEISGLPQIFVMQDDSAIFAKRYNTSDGTTEFAVYKLHSSEKPMGHPVQAQQEQVTQTPDTSFLLPLITDFTSRLDDIQLDVKAIKQIIRQFDEPTAKEGN